MQRTRTLEQVEEELASVYKEIDRLKRRRERLLAEKVRIKNTGDNGSKPIDNKDIQPLVQELIDRVGQTEAALRTGLSVQTLWRIRNGHGAQVRSSTARVIILALYQIRKEMRFNNVAWASQETFRLRERAERMLGY